MALDRRTFLRAGTATAAGVALGGPFQGFLARAAGAVGRQVAPALVPTRDLRDNALRLALPPGFAYRSFDANPNTMSDGTPQDRTITLPGNHDGMGAFKAGGRQVLLVRNHERNGSLGASTDDRADLRLGRAGWRHLRTGRSRRQPAAHVAGAGWDADELRRRDDPLGAWITCEETINGPDVFDDFTRNIPTPSPDGEQTYVQNVRLQKTHGYLFEVPANGTASAAPITQAGRLAHEAAVFDPITGSVFQTEDNFGFGSGFTATTRRSTLATPAASRTAGDSGCWESPGLRRRTSPARR